MKYFKTGKCTQEKTTNLWQRSFMCVTLWKTGWREIKFNRLIIQHNKYRLQLTCHKSIPECLKIKENCTELKFKMPFLASCYLIKRKKENYLSTSYKIRFLTAQIKSLSNGSLPNFRKLNIRKQATQKLVLKLFIISWLISTDLFS